MNISPDTLFSALSDATRLRCLVLLDAHGDLCVCELTYALGIAQPKASRHLGVLREAGLVLDRRAGVWIHYRLHPELPEWVVRVLAETRRGVAGTAPFAADAARLRRMPNRPGAERCA